MNNDVYRDRLIEAIGRAVQSFAHNISTSPWRRRGRIERAYVIGRQRAVTFRHRSLADIIASEIFGAATSGECGEGFTGVNLARWRDRFDARGAAYVCPAIVPPTRDWIVELVNWTGVQGDPQI